MTVVDAVRRFPVLVGAILAGTMVVVMIVGSLLPSHYTASASIVFRTPSSDTTTADVVDPQRFVEDQASVMKLRVVAESAASLATDDLAAGRMSGSDDTVEPPSEPVVVLADDIQDNLTVETNPDGNIVDVSYSADSPAVAATVTNAVVQSFQDVRRQQAQELAASAIEAVQTRIGDVTAEIDSLAAQVRELVNNGPGGEELLAEYDELLAQVVVLSERDDLNIYDKQSASSGLKDRIDSVDVATRLLLLTPPVKQLLDTQSLALVRRSELEKDLDKLRLRIENVTTDVAIVSPAEIPAEAGGPGLGKLALAGLVLGLMPAAAAAYVLASKRPCFEDAYEPQQLIGARLLAEVPDFKYERTSDMPVLSSPRTQAAEAFRFAASSLSVYRSMNPGSVFGIVSGTAREGKSVTIANLALASVRTESLCVVDADLDGQGFTGLMLPLKGDIPGLSDLLLKRGKRDRVTRSMKVTKTSGFDFITGGRAPADCVEALTGEGGTALIDELRTKYSLTLVDLPPLLSAAYASEVLLRCDGAIVVVPHGGEIRHTEEVVERLRLIGVPIAGYVYNRAPHRPERAPSMARTTPRQTSTVAAGTANGANGNGTNGSGTTGSGAPSTPARPKSQRSPSIVTTIAAPAAAAEPAEPAPEPTA